MGSAFLNDEAVRQAALARLAARAAEPAGIEAGHVAWSDSKRSVVGSLIASEDLDLWQTQLGLPAWLALVLEAAAGGQRDATGAVRLAAQVLNAIAPGADLDRQGSALILRLLDDSSRTIVGGQLEPALAEVLQDISALHRRALLGETVAPAAWKAARQRATRLSDALQEPQQYSHQDPQQLAVARCIESAGWDPQRSRTAVLDTLRQWTDACRAKSLRDYGWSAASDAKVQAQLDSLHARYVVGAPEPQPNVFELYEEHHPEDAATLRAMLAWQRENYWQVAALQGDLLLDFFQTVSEKPV